MPNTSRMPNFEKNFIQFLSQRQRNATKIRSNWVHVHVEKLGYGKLSEHLQRTGLATFDGGSWMLVEPQTANEFMAYLATCIANQTKQSKFIASTDDPKKLGLLASNKSEMARLTHKAIDAILPSPVEDVDIRDIVDFRDSNKQHLDALRSEVKLRVERSILTNSNNLDELFDLEIADLKNQANKLSTKMKQRNWGLIGFGSFTGLGSAILGAEPLLDGAVWDGACSTPRKCLKNMLPSIPICQTAFWKKSRGRSAWKLKRLEAKGF